MAHFLDAENPADMLLKAIRADPGLRETLRRRLGIKPVDHAAMDREIAELRKKLAQLEAMAPPPRVPTPPPYLYKTTASNGHNSQPRRTRP
ncbi:MAG TPA: hypothetical protein VND88_09650 [Candidatus Acidoferrales bacterium]|nr:hypothetical protein [Candidatus Acidoferrales bacterium]